MFPAWLDALLGNQGMRSTMTIPSAVAITPKRIIWTIGFLRTALSSISVTHGHRCGQILCVLVDRRRATARRPEAAAGEIGCPGADAVLYHCGICCKRRLE